MMGDEAIEYDIEPYTAELLRMFYNGVDLLERDEHTRDNSRAIARYLHTLTDMQKGQAIIDLLTMVGIHESIILEYKMREMEP